MPTFTVPFHEVNHCHGTGSKGHPCDGGESAERRVRPGRVPHGHGYKIVFASALGKSGQVRGPLNRTLTQHLTSQQLYLANHAKVALIFDGMYSAHLGSPILWKAPNGVMVFYDRTDRRGDADAVGRPSAGTYHDFSFGNEKVIPLTRNVGSGRRALRAWAAEHIEDKAVIRFKARQLVRSGD